MLDEQNNTEETPVEETNKDTPLSFDDALDQLKNEDTPDTEEPVEDAKPSQEDEEVLSASERLNAIKHLDKENRNLRSQLSEAEALKNLPDMLRTDPIGTLTQLGLTPEQILEALASNFDDDEPYGDASSEVNSEVEARVARLERELAEKEAQAQRDREAYAQEQVQAQEQEALNYLQNTVSEHSDRWGFVANTPEVFYDVLSAAEQDANSGIDIDDKWVEEVLDKAEGLLRDRYSKLIPETPGNSSSRKTLGNRSKVTDSPSGLSGLSFDEALDRINQD